MKYTLRNATGERFLKLSYFSGRLDRAKIHALDNPFVNKYGNLVARCGTQGHQIKFSDEWKEVTCKNCIRGKEKRYNKEGEK
jgi:hypothetical protein